MKTYKLLDEDRPIVVRYTLFLNAVVGEEGIYWHTYFYSGDWEHIDSPVPNGARGWERREEIDPEGDGAQILTSIAQELYRSYQDEIENLMYCDNCTESGSISIIYNPETKTFTFEIGIGVRQVQHYENRKTFDELVEKNPFWGSGEDRIYKKLNDDQYVQNLIDEQNGKTEFEFTYNGYGDSGEIESNLGWNNKIVQLGYEIIDLFHSGWENNEGADGEIYINLKDKYITLSHNENYDIEETEVLEPVKLI